MQQNISARNAVLKVQTDMAKVVITLKIMPDSPEMDLKELEDQIVGKIKAFAGQDAETRTTVTPIAFGLKSLDIMFVMNESLGSTDKLEADISKIKGISSVSVTDVRRTIG